MKLKKLCSAVVACAVLMTGCSATTTEENKGGDDAQNTSAAYPITIKHAYGETVIESEPKNIATISWNNQDTPLALGVVPVGTSKSTYGMVDENGLLPWTAEKYKELGVEKPVVYDDIDGLDYEAISDSNPDVILAAYSGITQEEYDLLSQIAPVIAYPGNAWQTLWRDQIITNAKGMGKEAEGKALVEELNTLIKEKTSKYKNLQGKKAVFCYFNPADLGTFSVYPLSDPRASYLTDLGLELPDSIAKLSKDENAFFINVSAENIDLLNDADMIVTYGDANFAETLKADPLLGTIPAVKNGAVAVVEYGSAVEASCTPSALSIPATIDDYLKLLGDAASKVK